MYRDEVPAYGKLCDIVETINAQPISSPKDEHNINAQSAAHKRLSAERHGAIRLGKAQELRQLAQIFKIMGMEPVNYYDLSLAGIPVHSTAFRPISRESLAANPFRIFTSLLRLDGIADQTLRHKAKTILERRDIIPDKAKAYIKQAQNQGGLKLAQIEGFIDAIVQIFKWHDSALIDYAHYQQFLAQHGLIADIVSFKGPHINHLTPRVLDIDAAQQAMQAAGLPAKAIIEGPPRRKVPILLRQTAFKALEEKVRFPSADQLDTPQNLDTHNSKPDNPEPDNPEPDNHNPDNLEQSHGHTARFGEIEARGAALTPKGHALYNQLLHKVRAKIRPAGDGSNKIAYLDALSTAFEQFPDDLKTLEAQNLIYVEYHITQKGLANKDRLAKRLSDELSESANKDGYWSALIKKGYIGFTPLIYEDFLPVSAAGIFQSNLNDRQDHSQNDSNIGNSGQQGFETALGQPVIDAHQLYAQQQQESQIACLKVLQSH